MNQEKLLPESVGDHCESTPHVPRSEHCAQGHPVLYIPEREPVPEKVSCCP